MLITSDMKIMGFLSAKKFIETWDELFRGFPLLPEFRHLQQHKHGGHSQLRVLLCAAWLQRHDSTLSDWQSDPLHHSIITHVFSALKYKYTTVWVTGQKDLCHVIKHTDRKHSIKAAHAIYSIYSFGCTVKMQAFLIYLLKPILKNLTSIWSIITLNYFFIYVNPFSFSW